MSSILIQNPLEPNNISTISKKNKKSSKKSKTKKQDYNKENIPNNIPHKKLTEEEGSSKELKLKEVEKDKFEQNAQISDKNFVSTIKPKNLSKRAYEKYEEKLKERTMRLEVDKIFNETERLKQEYEEKNTNYFLFNNPQFKKMVKVVEKQLYLILSLTILLNIFSIIIGTKLSRQIGGISLSSIIISILLLASTIILIAGVKIGLLNDPELSKAFRFFVILESLLLIISFCFNISSFYVNYNNNKNSTSIKLFTSTFLIIIVLDLIFVCKNCLNLFVESYMILLKRKTEYSVLILKEKNFYNRSNSESTLITSVNNESINKTNADLLEENDMNKNLFKEEKLDNDYKNYNVFNKFHYSVSSDRKYEENLKHINKNNINNKFIF